MIDKIVLASLSSFRATILKNAGLIVSVEGANIDERQIETEIEETSANKVAEKLAEAKALDVSNRFPNALVIGCDQVLELEGSIFHKPSDMEHAKRRLLALSGKTHHLHSAIALYKNSQVIWKHVETANMTVRPLDSAFIGRHLARVGNKILSSVGAYQIEGEGIQLFDKIEGDYFTIVGLPLIQLLGQLRKMGVIDV